MIDVISTPVTLGQLHLESSASIGICLFPDDGVDSGTLMKKADIAMYAAKKRGHGQYVFSNAQLDCESSERLLIESQLSQALKNREFILHFQPQVDAVTEQCRCVEALIRWQRPGGELMPPLSFIPVAEECGLIEPIGAWVLEEACRTLQGWRMHGVGDLTMAVNLSASQLKPALPGRVRELLARHDLPPRVLELEITESVAMRDPQQTIGVLRELASIGVGVAIDDFGTGHSSFAYLKRFPLSRLKIDRTFIEDIESDESDRELCAAMITMARNLGLRVVAEGVETAGQAEFLRNAGCHDFQGYLYSRPQPADQAEQFVVQRMRQHGGPSANVQKRI
jgi:diguanylate cyclase